MKRKVKMDAMDGIVAMSIISAYDTASKNEGEEYEMPDVHFLCKVVEPSNDHELKNMLIAGLNTQELFISSCTGVPILYLMKQFAKKEVVTVILEDSQVRMVVTVLRNCASFIQSMNEIVRYINTNNLNRHTDNEEIMSSISLIMKYEDIIDDIDNLITIFESSL